MGQHQTNSFTLYESQKEEEKGAEHIFEEEITTSLTLRRNRHPDPESAKSSHKNKWKSVMQKSTDFFYWKQSTDASDIWQDWKPTSLSNEEFTQLVFEAFDVCFVFQPSWHDWWKHIICVWENITSLLQYLPFDLVDQSILSQRGNIHWFKKKKKFSTHLLESDSLTLEYLISEFCCHMLWGSIWDWESHVPMNMCNL